jgi:hypothetical protein
MGEVFRADAAPAPSAPIIAPVSLLQSEHQTDEFWDSFATWEQGNLRSLADRLEILPPSYEGAVESNPQLRVRFRDVDEDYITVNPQFE